MPAQSLARDEAGNIWEVDAQGNPVRLHQPAQGGPNVVMPAAPPKPEFVPGNPNLVYTPGQGVSNLPGVPAPKAPAPNFVPGVPGYTVNDQGNAAPLPGLPGAGIQMDPSQRAKAIQQYNYAKQLEDTADQLSQLYLKGPGKTSGIEGLKDYFPTPDNKNFDTAANKSRGIVGQTLGFTGGQLNTPQEAEKAVGPYIPASGDFDSQILQKIQSMRDLAANGRQNAIQTLGGIPDENGVVHPAQEQPQQNVPPTLPGAGDGLGMNAGQKTRAQIDPMLRAVTGKAAAMMVNGAPDADIIKLLRDSGIDPAQTNIQEGLAFRRTPDFKIWMRHNPGKPYPFGPSFYTREVPISDARAFFNKTAANNTLGLGSVYSGFGAAANAITGGRLDNLSADPEMARLGMGTLRANHPISSLAGDIAGQATLEGLAGTIPGVRGLMATRMGRRGADALYGAYSGSGESDGNAGVGALEGAVSGLGMGMFGRGGQRAVGGLARGVQNAHLQYLDNLGVPLTIGQIGRGSNSITGRAIGGIEERAAGMPGFDAVIGKARQRGDKGFNEAAFREAGGSGVTGASGLDEIAKQRDSAYSFLDPLHLPIDAPFAGSQAGVRASIPGMPAYGEEVGKGLNLIDNVSGGGTISGRDWQSALRDTKANRVSISGQPFAKNATDALKDVEDNLQQLAARQGPSGTLDALNAANKLHAQVETVSAALDKGPVQRAGQMFSPQNLDDASRVNTRKYGGRLASLTGTNRPFYQLSQAGLDVMPNLTPDSGSAGRMLLVPLATSAIGGGIGAASGEDKGHGAELGADYGAALGLAAMGPYSRTGQKLIQRALLADRPQQLVRIGNYIVKANPKYAGMFGSGIGRDYFFQPESPQY